MHTRTLRTALVAAATTGATLSWSTRPGVGVLPFWAGNAAGKTGPNTGCPDELLIVDRLRRNPPVPQTPMSALSETPTPAQDTASAMDAQQLHQLPHPPDIQQQQPQNGNGAAEGAARKGQLLSAHTAAISVMTRGLLAKAPSVRRACTACHAGKTRCSEVLPCQVGATRPRTTTTA